MIFGVSRLHKYIKHLHIVTMLIRKLWPKQGESLIGLELNSLVNLFMATIFTFLVSCALRHFSSISIQPVLGAVYICSRKP